ncbi:MAG: YkgJ family cysteine cluster protein, partial [Deltaproteobacteria bacterium]|nr:YkgJ family cysteine cluster protein [Deltaproteobacteria bacterium]
SVVVPRTSTSRDDRPSSVEGVERRPVVAAPEGLRCGGGGTCCRLYGTVMLSTDEARRVRTVIPNWTVGPVGAEQWFTPLRGSEPTPVLAAIARDGACGWLRDDGLCAVHAAGGARAKPVGCQLFPRAFVDDGETVTVSLKPECPCVLAPRTHSVEPLVDPQWTHADQLPATVVVDSIFTAVGLVDGRSAPRADYRQWMAMLRQRPTPHDPFATAWALADAIEADGLGAPLDEAWKATAPAAALVRPWLLALHEHAAARAREHAAWRSERDLVRQASSALAMLTLVLRDGAALAEALAVAPSAPDQEARYWSARLHGHQWARSGSVVTALRDDALRGWLARSLVLVVPERADDPDWRAPLALVEALMRAHGIGAYVTDLVLD